ncbi:MAG: hypothetical protein H6765_05125 [Candidatus Peribacteria bacterium]|nr:MAG: hypothetical protein H6765_05125 [Candidatus Peribacteria bacterium]
MFRFIALDDGSFRFIDEREKIELVVNREELNRMHSFVGDVMKVKQLSRKEGISELMFREFQEGQYTTILEKPYLVYDIETTFDGYDFKNQYFEMAYSIQTDADHTQQLEYKYIDRSNMQKFCDYLLTYEGWIVGYNQI